MGNITTTINIRYCERYKLACQLKIYSMGSGCFILKCSDKKMLDNAYQYLQPGYKIKFDYDYDDSDKIIVSDIQILEKNSLRYKCKTIRIIDTTQTQTNKDLNTNHD